jgi:hypothetical protein
MIGEFAAAVAEATEETPEDLVFTVGPNKDQFYVDTDTGFVPYGRFAQAATSGLDTADMEGTAAVMDMLNDLIAASPGTGKTKAERAASARTKEQEWARFCYVCTKYKVKMDTLLAIIAALFEAQSARPTSQPSGSQNGGSATSAKSSRRRTGNGKSAAAMEGMKPLTAEDAAAMRATAAG